MENVTKTYKGTIRLGSKVMVSDPCYGLNTWCQGVLENVLPGTYDCYVEHSDEGDWGIRVSAIEITHISYKDKPIEYIDPQDFEVGVDSGQAGIFDYKYYKKYHSDAKERPHVDDNWYDTVADITLSRESAGVLDNASFVCSSGYGDGGYYCWTADNEDGQIIHIRVEFITEDEDED